ncbi:hypothetical protein [Lysobacter sp. Root690]|uniref:hypothetical protein n=1 Tax=Lysobacter sp. Root690 TaxID=1736588 RepID=UPI0012F72D11|nr:hypothetical protein [Lysobacter sp. Root690]
MLLTNGAPATLRCGLSLRLCGLLDDIGLDHAQVDAGADLKLGRGSERRREWLAIPRLYLDGNISPAAT